MLLRACTAIESDRHHLQQRLLPPSYCLSIVQCRASSKHTNLHLACCPHSKIRLLLQGMCGHGQDRHQAPGTAVEEQ